MRNVAVILFIGAGLLLGACSSESKTDVPVENGKPTLEQLTADLKSYEDSLKKDDAVWMKQEVAVEYADKCLEIANSFPKSDVAPKLMDKAHIILSSVGLYQRSVMIAETLVRKYPTYKNRQMVLESLASSYDIFIQPRKKEMVKQYYEMLLRDYPKMPEEQKKQIENRLKHVDLSFEDYISTQH